MGIGLQMAMTLMSLEPFGVVNLWVSHLDEDNQSELTEERIKAWVAGLEPEFGV